VSAPWVFGYGSLVWRPAFDHRRSAPARVFGWTRRFWQASPDHRGTPDDPGRVVTVLPGEGWLDGRAFQLPEAPDAILAALDHRERAGYVRAVVEAHLPGGEVVSALLYAAGRDNPNFVGEAPLDDLARRINRCAGPSGPNDEYVFRLAQALRGQRAVDEHVFAVEAAVRAAARAPTAGSC